MAKTNVVRKLYADGRVEEGTWKMSLKEMQAFVDGLIELVETSLPHRSLIVNDEGCLNNLPTNEAATALVRRGTLMIKGIQGNALLIKS